METIDFAKWQNTCFKLDVHVPGCPIVAYENEDGVCHHHACEGDHSAECGKIVQVID